MNDATPDMNRDSLPGKQPALRGILWLIPIVVLGMWLRCSQVRESLWLDELHTSWVVADGLQQIPARARAGNQSPLYFYLVWGTVQLLGHHEWTLRLPSLLAGTGLILATCGLVRRWSGSVTSGLLAALLVAVNRDCIFYAQEARPYALLQLLAVVHAALFVQLWQRPSWARRVAFVVGAVGLFYLHYTSFLFLLAEAACLAGLYLWGENKPRYRLRSSLLDAVAIGVLLVPASQHLLQIAHQRHNWSRIVDVWPSLGIQFMGAVYILLPVASAMVAARLGLPRTSFRWRSMVGVWTLCWFSVPPCLALLSTWSGLAALAMLRYLVASLVGAIVFASLGYASYTNRVYRCVLAVALVVSTIGTSGMIEQWRYDGRWIGDRNEPWNELVTWLNQRWPADPWPVFLCSGLLEDTALQDRVDLALRDYCLFPVRGLYPLAALPIEPLPTQRHIRLAVGTRQLAHDKGGAWIVIRAGEETAGLLVHSLSDQLAARPVEHTRFGNLVVIRLKP